MAGWVKRVKADVKCGDLVKRGMVRWGVVTGIGRGLTEWNVVWWGVVTGIGRGLRNFGRIKCDWKCHALYWLFIGELGSVSIGVAQLWPGWYGGGVKDGWKTDSNHTSPNQKTWIVSSSDRRRKMAAVAIHLKRNQMDLSKSIAQGSK